MILSPTVTGIGSANVETLLTDAMTTAIALATDAHLAHLASNTPDAPPFTPIISTITTAR